jgi:hypothetical protein
MVSTLSTKSLKYCWHALEATGYPPRRRRQRSNGQRSYQSVLALSNSAHPLVATGLSPSRHGNTTHTIRLNVKYLDSLLMWFICGTALIHMDVKNAPRRSKPGCAYMSISILLRSTGDCEGDTCLLLIASRYDCLHDKPELLLHLAWPIDMKLESIRLHGTE